MPAQGPAHGSGVTHAQVAAVESVLHREEARPFPGRQLRHSDPVLAGEHAAVVRLHVAGYRQHSCGNTLQGLSASPRVAPEPAAGRGRPAASGKPARFCQEETHVLAEQFSSMEHDAFRVPYLSDKTLETAFNGQARRPRRSTTLRIERLHRGTPDGSTEADERPLQRGDHPVVRELSRLGRSLGVRRGRARPDLRSAPRRGLAPGPGPRCGSSRAARKGSLRRLHGSRASFMSIRGLKPSPYRVFLHECCRYPTVDEIERIVI